ncbi:hypothetical protein AB2L28_19270 [Kineococcus sp. TBRC 1896]|uniref:Uncharacterized protein n=1 Tax=Kineococcus mangrovi TaxID=1660183 RepID=A0ABV4I9I2_9ACTN
MRDLDGCTDPLTTVLDCLRCLPPRFALEELQAAAAAMNRNDPRRRLVVWVDPECGSALESVARYDLLDVELRRLGLQVLRFSWEQVVRQRERWLRAVRDVHAQGRPA